MNESETNSGASAPQVKAPREADGWLATVVESAMDAIISVDSDQRIVVFNAAAEAMFECRAAEVCGQPLDRFIPGHARAGHQLAMEAFHRTGQTARRMGALRPLTALRTSGEEFPIEASISQAVVDGRRFCTVIIRDISDRQRAEDQNRRMNAELERRVEERTAELLAANRDLEAFASSVAHDLRAPLRHIDAFAGILLEEHAARLPPDARHYLERIGGGSRHLSRMIEGLLALAHLGRQELTRQPVPLNELVAEVIADLDEETVGRGVEWRVGPLATVSCDRPLMKQVLANLIGNAVKYTRPRPVAVIEVGATEQGGGPVFFVRDNGVGFDMAHAGKLFGVFQRLHCGEDFEGTGVGLATVQRIIRRHRGRIWAEAAVGQGAAFYFTVG